MASNGYSSSGTTPPNAPNSGPPSSNSSNAAGKLAYHPGCYHCQHMSGKYGPRPSGGSGYDFDRFERSPQDIAPLPPHPFAGFGALPYGGPNAPMNISNGKRSPRFGQREEMIAQRDKWQRSGQQNAEWGPVTQQVHGPFNPSKYHTNQELANRQANFNIVPYAGGNNVSSVSNSSLFDYMPFRQPSDHERPQHTSPIIGTPLSGRGHSPPRSPTVNSQSVLKFIEEIRNQHQEILSKIWQLEIQLLKLLRGQRSPSGSPSRSYSGCSTLVLGSHLGTPGTTTGASYAGSNCCASSANSTSLSESLTPLAESAGPNPSANFSRPPSESPSPRSGSNSDKSQAKKQPPQVVTSTPKAKEVSDKAAKPGDDKSK